MLVVHDTSLDLTQPIEVYRGHIILNHIVNQLTFAGAEVRTVHCSNDTKEGGHSSGNEYKIKVTSDNLTASEKRNSSERDLVKLILRCSGKTRADDNAKAGVIFKYRHLIDTETGKAWRASAEDLKK